MTDYLIIGEDKMTMGKFSICLTTLIPVRIHPSERAEMITQLIFGELFIIQEITGNWAKITTTFDAYEGWIDKKVIHLISEETFLKIAGQKPTNSHKIISSLSNLSSQKILPLVAGSTLPFINDRGEFTIEDQKFHYKHKTKTITATPDSLIQIAKQYENAPYLWGGRTVLGIDCSGFTQIVYKIAGIKLHRDASQQVTQGSSVSFIDEAQPGDLAFFDNEEGQIIHVGIMLNKSTIIHASGWVKIDKIDHQGIFNTDTLTYSHKLRVIRRII